MQDDHWTRADAAGHIRAAARPEHESLLFADELLRHC